MRVIWIWQQMNWPKFYWDDSRIITSLSNVRLLQGFLKTMEGAIMHSYETLSKVRQKAIFWQNNSEVTFNERQVKILNRMLDGFEVKLTTSKYAKICHTSQATALRDIQDLLERDVLIKNNSGGRSSSYGIKC